MNSPDNLDDLLDDFIARFDFQYGWNTKPIPREMALQIAQAIRSLREQRWVKVEEFKKSGFEGYCSIIRKSKEGPVIAFYDGKFRISKTSTLSFTCVTKVLPLPSPPEGV